MAPAGGFFICASNPAPRGPASVSFFGEKGLTGRRDFAEVLLKATLRLYFVGHVAHSHSVRSTGCFGGIFG